MGSVSEDLAAAIIDRHGFEPRPRVRRELVEKIDRELQGLTSRADNWYQSISGVIEGQLPVQDVRKLVGEARITILVWSCPECGDRVHPVPGQQFPPRCFEHFATKNVTSDEWKYEDAVPMEPTEIVVRKLPEGFKHIDQLAGPVPMKYITKVLPRELEQTRQIQLSVRYTGGFRENAELVARWVAEQAGHDFFAGRLDYAGEGEDVIVRWFVDPDAGVAV